MGAKKKKIGAICFLSCMLSLFNLQTVLHYLGLDKHGWTICLACLCAVGLWARGGMLYEFVLGQLMPSFRWKVTNLCEKKRHSDMQRTLFG